jgi:hypothetical protein
MLKKNAWLILIALFFAAIWGPAIVQQWQPVVHAQVVNGGTYLYINTATTTVVKNGPGTLYVLTVNGGATGAVTLYDIVSSGCTGTPASGKFATIQAATAPVSLPYNLITKNGLCVVTATAADVTVSYN